MSEVNWWGGGQISLEKKEPEEIKEAETEDAEEPPKEDNSKKVPDVNYFGGEF